MGSVWIRIYFIENTYIFDLANKQHSASIRKTYRFNSDCVQWTLGEEPDQIQSSEQHSFTQINNEKELGTAQTKNAQVMFI